MTSSMERLAVEPAPRRKAKTVALFPPTPTTVSDDELQLIKHDTAEAIERVRLALDARLADLETRRPPDVTPLTEDIARANRVIAEMAQTINAQTAAINDLKARPAAPSRLSEHVLGALRAVAMVLAVRFLLLLSLFGTFVLAVMAMTSQTYVGLGLTAAFAVLTLVPLAALEVWHRPKPEE